VKTFTIRYQQPVVYESTITLPDNYDTNSARTYFLDQLEAGDEPLDCHEVDSGPWRVTSAILVQPEGANAS
jgi:hypothetical protein